MRLRLLGLVVIWSLAGCGGTEKAEVFEDLPLSFPDLGRADAPAQDDGNSDIPMDQGMPDNPGRADVPGDPGNVADGQDQDPGASDQGSVDPGTVDPGPGDTGPEPERCGSGPACGPGTVCIEGSCDACIFDHACGPECSRCTGTPTSICHKGQCVRCVRDVDCGVGFYCDQDSFLCERCRDDDPLHCGVTCLACPESLPVCSTGACRCTAESCGELYCVDGSCQGCDTDNSCGPTCQPCPFELPRCVLGKCVLCREEGDCPAGEWCNQGTCVPCTNDDPLHCGSDCLSCVGNTPACFEGACVCEGSSCGLGRRCVDRICESCDKDEACGHACVACVSPRPYCVAAACRECRNDLDCPARWTCTGEGTCLDPCLGTLGCANDFVPDGKTCAKAKVIGRKVAMAGTTITGDTTDQGNNDDLPSIGTDCWDAQVDVFYRVWLRANDRLDITATPLDSMYRMSLKLYRGTACRSNYQSDLVTCQHKNGDGKAESIAYTATGTGWHTIVVDGASAFAEERDWGRYSLAVRITCSDIDCCCP